MAMTKHSGSIFFYSHFLLLVLGFGAVGWFLAAIQAKVFVWLSLYSLVIYLVNTQRGGIVLAHGWVSLVISISAVTRIWPSVWPPHIPYEEPRLWAIILLIVWGIAATLVHLLATSPLLLRQKFPQHPWIMSQQDTSVAISKAPVIVTLPIIVWVGGAIALGSIIYSLGVNI